MKKTLAPVIVLTVICFAVALALAFVNEITAPVIEENAGSSQSKSLSEVLSGGKFGSPMTELTNLPDTVKAVYEEKSGMGYALVLATSSQYSSEDMGITVGIDKNGVIRGIVLTAYFESKDFGRDTYPKTFIGKDGSLAGIELVSGVTYSSRAFKEAVADAFTALSANGLIAAVGETSGTPETTAPEIDIDTQVLTDVMEGGRFGSAMTGLSGLPQTVKAVYKEETGKGYVVILSTSTKFSSADMVFALGIKSDGIIGGVKLVSYNESRNVGDAYINSYIGKGASLEGVDLVSGVTFSSTAFKDAVADAFTALTSNSLITGNGGR